MAQILISSLYCLTAQALPHLWTTNVPRKIDFQQSHMIIQSCSGLTDCSPKKYDCVRGELNGGSLFRVTFPICVLGTDTSRHLRACLCNIFSLVSLVLFFLLATTQSATRGASRVHDRCVSAMQLPSRATIDRSRFTERFIREISRFQANRTAPLCGRSDDNCRPATATKRLPPLPRRAIFISRRNVK